MTLLSGWDKRVKLKLDSGDVTSSLSWFPVLVYLSTSSGINSKDVSFIFDELQSDANRKKIAITKSDGITQLYVEIEKWDDANEQAWLHVSRDDLTISDSEDTVLYLYYDREAAENTAFVGDPNSAVAEKVWDSNFKLVCHMNDDPDTSHVRDSTSNSNDGTKKGANEPTEDTGKIGKAQHFDGTDDKITIGNVINMGTGSFVLEAWINPDTSLVFGATVVGKQANYNMGRVGYGMYFRHDIDDNYFNVGDGVDGVRPTHDMDLNVWQYLVNEFDGTTKTAKIYINGDFKISGQNINIDNTDNALDLIIGYSDVYFDGHIDEVRITKGAIRDSAWIKASYETQRDHFITYGNEEILSGTFGKKPPGPPVPRPDFPIYLMKLIRDYVEAM